MLLKDLERMALAYLVVDHVSPIHSIQLRHEYIKISPFPSYFIRRQTRKFIYYEAFDFTSFQEHRVH